MKMFIETSVLFPVKCSIYLLINLPLENQTIADAKKNTAFSSAISGLTLSIAEVLGIN